MYGRPMLVCSTVSSAFREANVTEMVYKWHVLFCALFMPIDFHFRY